MKENDFKPKFKTAAEVLKSLLDGQGNSNISGAVSDNFLRWKLWLNWKDVVGPTLSEQCEPVSYHRGLLWIWVKNSVWMQQMTFMSTHIKSAIDQNYKNGYVKEIRFTLDRRWTPARDDQQFAAQVSKFGKNIK